MIFLFRSLLLVTLAPALLADSSSDAVNERIPVQKIEMASHWGVDCQASWAAMEEVRSQMGEQACVLPSSLLRQLQLCAFIYQPPGEPLTHVGPDFNSILEGGTRSCVPNVSGKKQ